MPSEPITRSSVGTCVDSGGDGVGSSWDDDLLDLSPRSFLAKADLWAVEQNFGGWPRPSWVKGWWQKRQVSEFILVNIVSE